LPTRNVEVDRYLDSISEDRRAALNELREVCLELLEDFDETMRYGMPGYERNGEVEVGFASQKQYISLYILRTDILNAHREQLGGLSVGKGCIRYRRPDQIDMEVVRSMLKRNAATTGPIC